MKGFTLGIIMASIVWVCVFVSYKPVYAPIAITSVNTTPLSESGYIKSWQMIQDITVKYLDDGTGYPGLVVKWASGEMMQDIEGNWVPVNWIQRFEPWLNERSNITYRVTWESEER